MATRKLEVQIVGDSRQLDRTLGKSQARMQKFGAVAKKAAAGLSLGFGAGAVKAIDAASDLDESINKATQTFEKSAPRIRRWSETTAASLGLSQQAALEGASSFGAMLKPMGIAPARAAAMSKKMTILAADMASFNNQDPSEMLDRLRAGLSGESEPLKRFGTVLTETRVKTHAYKVGIAEVGTELTEQQKIQARYSLLLRDTADQQGDFGRTSGGVANQQRILKAQVENLSATLGRNLLPAIKTVLTAINGFIRGMRSGVGVGGAFRRVMESIGHATSEAWRVARQAVGVATQAIRTWLVQNRQEIAKVRQAFVNIGRAIRTVMVDVIYPVIKRVWPGIRQIIQGVLRTITGIVKVFSGALTGDWRRLWNGVKQILSGTVKTFGGIIRAATAPVRAAIVAVTRPVINVVRDAVTTAGKVLGTLVRPFRRVFGVVKDVVSTALGPLREFRSVLSKIGSLASKLGDLTGAVKGFFGGIGSGGPELQIGFGDLFKKIGGSGIDKFKPLSLAMGLSGGMGPDQGFRPGDPGFHGRNRARDHSGPPGAMMAFARLLYSLPNSGINELIYTPLGVGIDAGRKGPIGSLFPSKTLEDHYDHVHVAMAKGGTTKTHVRALVGEEGPEIVDLPKGARVHPFSKSKRMVASGLFPGFAGGGIVTAVNAARKAGLRARKLVEAVAIAGPESGYNPRARALTGQEDSRGLWQINTYAHPWARALNLYNPLVNAKAMMRVSGGGSNWGPWTGYTSGAYRGFLGRAREAVLATRRSNARKGRKPAPKRRPKRPVRKGDGKARNPLIGKGMGRRPRPDSVDVVDSVVGDAGVDPAVALAEAIAAAAAEMAALRAATEQQNRINSSVLGVSTKEAIRVMADTISGQLGPRVALAGQSAGNPSISRRY